MATQVRENYPEECEALINQQICIELSASYTYLYMVSLTYRTYSLWNFLLRHILLSSCNVIRK